ncbi:MAG: T9SS type A sorting domain-containing protein [Ignavibacteriales bacterium]|nr:T9SS type A sorting domain-containing protein [Ignavibacteriales bacterium]
MKKLYINLLLFILVSAIPVFAQTMMGGGTGFMFPDTLKQVTLSGKITVDTLHVMPIYYLDLNGDETNEYYLNFGPIWYKPDNSTATRPKNGDQVTIKGGQLDSIMNMGGLPMIIVYQINGQLWRDPFDPMWNDFGDSTHMMGHHSGNCMGYAFGSNGTNPHKVTITGLALVDTTFFMNQYYLDENNDGKPNYYLNFGPWWYEPNSGVIRPKNGDAITIVGGKLQSSGLPVVIVYMINDKVWRDSTLIGKNFGGGWMHKNKPNDKVFNPFDENDFMMMDSGWNMGGMMSDSLFGRMLELNPINIPNRNGEHIFKGYEFGMFNPKGSNGMMQGGSCGGMMNFGSSSHFQFHFDDKQMQAYGTDKNTIKVKYWDDQNSKWKVISDAVINLTSNTVTFSTNQMSSFYILTSDNVTGVKNTEIIPGGYSLKQNYPNPFNPSTTIEFETKNNSFINLKVYNVLGQEVAVLINKQMEAGLHIANFNAGALSSGIYFYELRVDGNSLIKKMNLLR